MIARLLIAIVAYLLLRYLFKLAGRKYSDWRTQRALNGKYGEPTMWSMQLIEEDEDMDFCHAISALPQWEVMEVGIVAESKEELRERMIDRYEEHYE